MILHLVARGESRRRVGVPADRIGIYYGSRTLETAIRETAYHKERYARERGIRAQDFHMQAWVGEILKACYDVRAPLYSRLHDPDDYLPSQQFTRHLLAADAQAYGNVYRSVRHPGGDCLAALRPVTVLLHRQGAHLVYRWDGTRIIDIVEQSTPLVVFTQEKISHAK